MLRCFWSFAERKHPTETPLTNMPAWIFDEWVLRLLFVKWWMQLTCTPHTHIAHTHADNSHELIAIPSSIRNALSRDCQYQRGWAFTREMASKTPKINRAEMNLFAIYVKITSITFTSLIFIFIFKRWNTAPERVAAQEQHPLMPANEFLDELSIGKYLDTHLASASDVGSARAALSFGMVRFVRCNIEDGNYGSDNRRARNPISHANCF